MRECACVDTQVQLVDSTNTPTGTHVGRSVTTLQNKNPIVLALHEKFNSLSTGSRIPLVPKMGDDIYGGRFCIVWLDT